MPGKPPRNPKVFGIGLHKTGTSSLGLALEQLGYRVCGYFMVEKPVCLSNVKERAFAKADRFDAFQDNPWPVLYEELDDRYPDSKFILTVRPLEEWIRSTVAFFGTETTSNREWIYGAGCPEGNEEIYLERYERHNREVREYFAGRPGDLLELRLTEGEGWEELCAFLDVPVPGTPWPHANNASAARRRPQLIQRIYDHSPAWLQDLESTLWKKTRALHGGQ